MTYRVDTEWDDTGRWVVTVPAVPGAITQCRRLDQVPADAAEVIEIQAGKPVDPDTLDVHPCLRGVAAEARRLRVEAHALNEKAGERTRAAVDLLYRRGSPCETSESSPGSLISEPSSS